MLIKKIKLQVYGSMIDEKHMKEVRSYLSQFNSIPNSLSPKEIAYEGEVKVSAKNKN